MKKWLPLAAGALLGFAVIVAFGADRFFSIDEGEAQAPTRYRWLDVTIEVPAGAEFLTVSREPKLSDNPAHELANRYRVSVFDHSADSDSPNELVIDAESGDVLLNSLSDLYPVETQSIIDSIIVGSDPPTVWPYVDGPVPAEVRSFGEITYVLPSAESGLQVAESIGLCPEAECYDISLSDGRTLLVAVDATNGSVISTGDAAADSVALSAAAQRFVDAVGANSSQPGQP